VKQATLQSEFEMRDIPSGLSQSFFILHSHTTTNMSNLYRSYLAQSAVRGNGRMNALKHQSTPSGPSHDMQEHAHGFKVGTHYLHPSLSTCVKGVQRLPVVGEKAAPALDVYPIAGQSSAAA